MSGPELILVVPCYNEEQRFDPAAFASALEAHPYLRFVFVDDGSSDATRDVLTRFSEEEPEGRCHVLALGRNQGKAAAVREGVLAALRVHPPAAWVGYWDADLATPFDELPRFYEVIGSTGRARLVAGARVRLMGRSIERKPHRHMLGRVFATFASLALHMPIYDTQCGAKLIERSLAAELFAEPFLTRWIFDVELLARLVAAYGPQAARDEVAEVPLGAWSDVSGSKVKGGDFAKAPAELLKIWARYLK